MLKDALNNILREITLFDNILGSPKHRPEIKDCGEPRPETEAYTKILKETVHSRSSLLVDLTILWGTEKCYLEAWQFAKDSHNRQSSPENKSTHDAQDIQDADSKSLLLNTLISNWTCSDFVDFVKHIENLTNELANSSEYASDWQNCRDIWTKVLSVEKGFWPAAA